MANSVLDPKQDDKEDILQPFDVDQGINDLENFANQPSQNDVDSGISDLENYANNGRRGSQSPSASELESRPSEVPTIATPLGDNPSAGQLEKGAKEGSSKIGNGGEKDFAPNINTGAPSQTKPSTRSLRGALTSKKSAFVATVALIAGLIGIFFAILPLRLDYINSIILSRTSAVAEDLLEERIEHLVGRRILQAFVEVESCARANPNLTIRITDCNLGPFGKKGTYGEQLYSAWRTSGLIEEVFTEADIEFSYNPSDNKYTMITPTGEFDLLGNEFRNAEVLSRSEFSKQINSLIKEKTAWNQVWKRRGLRRAAKNWGVYRWAIGGRLGELRDTSNNLGNSASRRVRLIFGERVMLPLSDRYGTLFLCLIDGCDSTDLADRLRSRSDISSEAIEEVREAIENDDSNNYIVRTLLKKIGIKLPTGSIPYVGQVITAILVVGAIADLDELQESGALNTFQYNITAGASTSIYTLVASNNDEIKNGQLDLETIGAINAQFDGIESSMLYQAIQAENGSQIAAASEPANCGGNNEPIPSNQLVCPEQRLDYEPPINEFLENPIVSNMVDRASCPSLIFQLTEVTREKCADAYSGLAKGINFVTDFIGEAVFSQLEEAIKSIPIIGSAYQSLTEFTEEQFTKLIDLTTSKLFAVPDEEDIVGTPRAFEYAYAGSEVLQATYLNGGINEDGTTFGAGLPMISDEEYQTLQANALEEEYSEFKALALHERLFSRQNHRSLVAQMSLSSPNIELSNNPIAMLWSTIANIPQFIVSNLQTLPLAFNSATFANTANLSNPFGAPRFGIPINDPYFTSDPDIYTEEFCEGEFERWRQTYDEATGQYSGFNRCLIEEAAANAAGSTSTTLDDASLTDRSQTIPTQTVSTSSKQELAQKILDSGRVTGDSRYMAQIEQVAAGDFSCNINPTVLSLLEYISRNYTVYLTSLNRLCTGVLTASGTRSLHYREGGGHAFDIGTVNGVRSTGATDTDIQLINELLPLLPKGSGIGQSSCRSRVNKRLVLPSGIVQFTDSCNHIHIQVPVQ